MEAVVLLVYYGGQWPVAIAGGPLVGGLSSGPEPLVVAGYGIICQQPGDYGWQYYRRGPEGPEQPGLSGGVIIAGATIIIWPVAYYYQPGPVTAKRRAVKQAEYLKRSPAVALEAAPVVPALT